MGVDAVIRFDSTQELTHKDLQDLSWNLGRAFGAENFFMSDPDGLAVVKDGADKDPDYPEKGVYNLKLWTRYYGEGYERGNFPFLFMLWEFLQARGFTVYYGGDSDNNLDLVDEDFKREALRYWASTSETHLAFFSRAESLPTCPRCDKPMPQTTWVGLTNPEGFKGNRYSCEGCENVMDGEFKLVKKQA